MTESRSRFRWLFIAVVAVALAVRLYRVDWDDRHFFHPDERRIGEAVHQLSFSPLQLNPRFFAYGSFPFYVTKTVTAGMSAFSGWFRSYDAAILTGRVLSALWGAATVALLMLLARRRYGEKTALLAGLLLAGTVLHVQNSHFATNDVPLTFLVLLALYLCLDLLDRGTLWRAAGAGAVVGLALATKISALPLFLSIGVALWFRRPQQHSVRALLRPLAVTVVCAIGGFLVGQPSALTDARNYLASIMEQSRMVRQAGLFPFTNQYIGTIHYLYELSELALWGMGILLGVSVLIGTVRRLRVGLRAMPRQDVVLFSWVLPYFLVIGSFEVKFVRYLLPVYPLLVLWGADWLTTWAERARAGRWARGVVVAGTALYLAAFMTIYTRPHAAVSASEWCYRSLRTNAKILTQDWDEGFPLPIPGEPSDEFKVVTFPYYDPDTPGKVAHLAGELASSDYVVLQTKRILGAVTRAPQKFPFMNNYFRLLFAGDLGYTLVRDVTSDPGLFGVTLPTELADESFSIYDHPKAWLFRNTSHKSAAELARAIQFGVPTRALSRTALLLARAGEASGDLKAGPKLIRSSPGATVLCVLLIELLGLAGYAMLRTVLPERDGLYALAKVLGVFSFAYVAWLLASLGIAAFTQALLLGTVALLMLLGAMARRGGCAPLPVREIVLTEVVVWLTFAFFLGLRAANPEIYWGEKPMDFSFLNALYRSTHLPPPEPWFAGSPLSYTYFGHFLVAAVGKALAIHPALMFNLGIALVAALTAAALFAAGSALVGTWRAGAIAVALTLYTGNLSGVGELLIRRVANFDYFWATARVIPNTINEYPFWSFVFADLHAHVLAMPFAVSLVALLLLWVRRPRESRHTSLQTTLALLVLSALMLGAISVTNGWSMPTYVALTAVVLAFSLLRDRPGRGAGAWLAAAVVRVIVPAALVVGGAFLAYLPFWRNFSPPARAIGWEVGPFAQPSDYLTIFGLFLVLLVPFIWWTWRDQLSASGRMPRTARIATMATLAGVLLLALLNVRSLLSPHWRQAPSIFVFAAALAALAATLACRRDTHTESRLPLLLAAFALALTAGCELVFVWDRMNTVFKFYLEAWLLLGLACTAAVWQVTRTSLGGPRGRRLWLLTGGAALALALFTAVTGAYGALAYRHAIGPRFTLDGMAYLRSKAPDDLAAYEWLDRNVRGIPVLAEAQGPSYQDYSRVCMNTGLPIVLGWDYHVFQRGHTWEEINQRKEDVAMIFTADSKALVASLLRRYHVALVYVGTVERQTYNGANLHNFRTWTDVLTPLYDSSGVTVFAVNEGFVPGVAVSSLPQVVARPTPASAPSVEGVRQNPPGALRQPRSLAVDHDGNVYVADFGNCRIQKFDAKLKALAAWGKRGTGPGEFQDPCGVAIGPDNNVYVADTWNSRIQVFNATGVFLREWKADFFGPRGIAVDPRTGSVFVVDTGNGRVFRFSAEGILEKQWGEPGKEHAQFSDPVGIAVDDGGSVYVCDNGNGRLQVFNRDGRFARAMPVPGWRREVFSEPSVIVDKGVVKVTVPLAGEIRSYTADGTLQTTLAAPVPESKEPARPIGIALAPDGGTLYVSDIAGSLRAVAVVTPSQSRQPPTRQ